MRKNIRNEIYRKAKEIYIFEINGVPKDEIDFGMCYAVRKAAIKLGYQSMSVNSDIFNDSFPELIKLKPKHASINSFWWERKSTRLRINRFNKIIEQTDSE